MTRLGDFSCPQCSIGSAIDRCLKGKEVRYRKVSVLARVDTCELSTYPKAAPWCRHYEEEAGGLPLAWTSVRTSTGPTLAVT